MFDINLSKSKVEPSHPFIFFNNLFRHMETADLVRPTIFAMEVTDNPAFNR